MRIIDECATCTEENCANCDLGCDVENDLKFCRITAAVFVTFVFLILAVAYVLMEWIPDHSGKAVCGCIVVIPFAFAVAFGRRILYKTYIKWRTKRVERRLLLNEECSLSILLVRSGALSCGGGVFSGGLKLPEDWRRVNCR